MQVGSKDLKHFDPSGKKCFLYEHGASVGGFKDSKYFDPSGKKYKNLLHISHDPYSVSVCTGGSKVLKSLGIERFSVRTYHTPSTFFSYQQMDYKSY
jgi:hypothetical protein